MTSGRPWRRSSTSTAWSAPRSARPPTHDVIHTAIDDVISMIIIVKTIFRGRSEHASLLAGSTQVLTSLRIALTSMQSMDSDCVTSVLPGARVANLRRVKRKRDHRPDMNGPRWYPGLLADIVYVTTLRHAQFKHHD